MLKFNFVQHAAIRYRSRMIPMTTTYKSPWIYNEQILRDVSEFPEGTLGFIYKITHKETGKLYIGKKLAYFKKTSVKTVTLKNGNKKKKKTTTLVPSDWLTYWSSSANLVADVEKLGEEAFERRIMFFCFNKGSLSYYETRLQMDLRVLEIGEGSYNGIVSCRVHHTHIKPILI
jgi:hypothetical protein